MWEKISYFGTDADAEFDLVSPDGCYCTTKNPETCPCKECDLSFREVDSKCFFDPKPKDLNGYGCTGCFYNNPESRMWTEMWDNIEFFQLNSSFILYSLYPTSLKC